MSFLSKIKKGVGIEEENLEEEEVEEEEELEDEEEVEEEEEEEEEIEVEKEPEAQEEETEVEEKETDDGSKEQAQEIVAQQAVVRAKKLKRPLLRRPKKLEARQARLGKSVKRSWPQPTGELAVDMYQTGRHIVIQATIAGVKPSQLDVSFENDMVIIAGERLQPAQDEGNKKYLYQECYWGPFARKIIIPDEIDVAKAEAAMKQGVLTVRVPRAPKRKMKKVLIREE